jgi:6,7-dimethyl-8-ribityllumazine synthase
MHEITPGIPRRPVKIAIAAAQFNRFITDELLAGAREALTRHNVADEDITLAWVPGAYELPLACAQLLERGDFDGVIALGAVIRGGTPHFDYVAGECSRGLQRVSLDHGKPVMFGVLTTDTIEQALERAARDQGNKGFDVTLGLLNMIDLADRIANDE